MTTVQFDAEYVQSEYLRRVEGLADKQWGWSFMYVPQERLHTANVMLIGLNPGGNELNPQYEWDYRGVNAYVDEPWAGLNAGQHPLQQQVRQLFDAIGVDPSDVFAANFVPFRSPSWRDLPDPTSALDFSRVLWRDLIAKSPARLFITLGKRAGKEIASLINATEDPPQSVEWGRQTISTYRNTRGQAVLALPHLSRFRIFGYGRTKAATYVANVATEIGI